MRKCGDPENMTKDIWGLFYLILVWVCIATGSSTTNSPGGEELPGKEAEHSSLESSCSLKCNCVYLQNAKGIEYRASCEGNGTEEIVLTDLLFRNEATPNRSTNVYVKVTNFTLVDVRGSFLSRWLAYKSCSMDIWFTSSVFFPAQSPTIGPSANNKHVFAGISIAFSHIHRLPTGLFQNKSEGQLWLTSVKIEDLRLDELMDDASLRNLAISNSSISRFYGSEEGRVKLKRNGVFKIRNSVISHMEMGAINLEKSRGNPPVVSFYGTKIHTMHTSSIILGEEVICNFENNTIGTMMPNVFTLVEGSILRARLNYFTAGMDCLKNIKCGSDSHNLKQNVLYDPEYIQCDIEPMSLSPKCLLPRSIFTYLHPSCSGNFLAKATPPESFAVLFTIIIIITLLIIGMLIAVIMWLKIFQENETQKSGIVYGDSPTTYFAAPLANTPISTFDDYADPRSRKISQTLSFGIPVSMVHNDDVYPMDDFVFRMQP